MPDQIERIAMDLINMDPDPVPEYLIMRDFLSYRFSPEELAKARAEAFKSKQISTITKKQLSDGSWGSRFHYYSNKIKDVSVSTETAIVRLQALGVDPDFGSMKHAIKYMENILLSNVNDLSRINPYNQSENTFKLIVASRLRELVPDHPLVLAYAEKLLKIIKSSFSNGYFNETSFAQATEDFMGTRLTTECKICFSVYPLILLRGLVEYKLEQQWIHHIVFNRRGINLLNNRSVQYLPLSFPSAESTRYIEALDLLSWYPSATEFMANAADWLWNQASYEGLWDLGSFGKDGLSLPYSNNWRSPKKRLVDSSIRVLSVLRRFQTSCSVRENICHTI